MAHVRIIPVRIVKPMKKNWNIYMAAIGIALCLAGCAGSGQSAAAEGETDEVLVIYCPHPLEFINPIVSEFENIRRYFMQHSYGRAACTPVS